MKDKKATGSRGKWKIFRIVIVRIIVLAAVVVGYSLPLPWKIIVPLSIGTVTILFEAFTCLKRPSGQKEVKSYAKEEKPNKKAARKDGKDKASKTQ